MVLNLLSAKSKLQTLVNNLLSKILILVDFNNLIPIHHYFNGKKC